jgi:hypothetical protein
MTENEVARAHSTCRYTGAWRPAGGCDRPSRGLVASRPPARLPPPQRLPVGYPFLVAIQRETTCSPWTLRARSPRGEFGAKEIGTRPALKPAAQAARWDARSASTANKHLGRLVGPALFCAAIAVAGPASAQPTPGTPPSAQTGPNAPGSAQQTPNAETPPGGIARGVIPAPHAVDPGMVTPPPASAQGTMPVLKPPAAAR